MLTEDDLEQIRQISREEARRESERLLDSNPFQPIDYGEIEKRLRARQDQELGRNMRAEAVRAVRTAIRAMCALVGIVFLAFLAWLTGWLKQ